jgi:hypothetical protein
MEKVYILKRLIKEVAVDRRQMTLNLNDKEMDLLDRLSERRGMSKTALVRQALRLYQSVTERIERGEKVFVEHPGTKDKAELMVL